MSHCAYASGSRGWKIPMQSKSQRLSFKLESLVCGIILLRQMNVFLASLFNAALGGFLGWCRSLLHPPPSPLHLFCLFLKLNFAREDFWFVHTAAAKKFRSQGLHPNFPAALPATLFPKGDSDCQLVFPLATISVADKMSLDFTFFTHLWDGVDFGDINLKSPNK